MHNKILPVSHFHDSLYQRLVIVVTHLRESYFQMKFQLETAGSQNQVYIFTFKH